MERLCLGKPCEPATLVQQSYDSTTASLAKIQNVGIETLGVMVAAEDPWLRLSAEEDASLIDKAELALWESRENTARWLAQCKLCTGLIDGRCPIFEPPKQ